MRLNIGAQASRETCLHVASSGARSNLCGNSSRGSDQMRAPRQPAEASRFERLDVATEARKNVAVPRVKALANPRYAQSQRVEGDE
ncbi:hypothetical protein GCM10011609_86800 [Lentzea pudingi]|uniref:Uncharacterized protein n=1 Tax=Lentzea pudingi TaxID=1789439 RepID=A0ABQ2IWV0_9PSEU|nr:hypothetical protein GCM10011609_86800 [Lentzea pudingi]